MACEPAILDPKWAATLCVYWEAAPRDQRLRVHQFLARAQAEASAERCIHELQQGLRALGLTELQIIRLVLLRCLDLAESAHVNPVAQVADEVQRLIESLDRRRRRGRTPSVGSVP